MGFIQIKLLRTGLIKNVILDYQKTVELYKKVGQVKKWEDTPEYLSIKCEKLLSKMCCMRAFSFSYSEF